LAIDPGDLGLDGGQDGCLQFGDKRRAGGVPRRVLAVAQAQAFLDQRLPRGQQRMELLLSRRSWRPGCYVVGLAEARDASGIGRVGLGARQHGLAVAGDAQGIAHQDHVAGGMQGGGRGQVIRPGRFHAHADGVSEGRQPGQARTDPRGRVGEAADVLRMRHVEPAGGAIDPERLDRHQLPPARE
jgi:hypothetical protein